jgi:Chaperone of endosialidase
MKTTIRLVPLVLTFLCLAAIAPKAQAVNPPPDGGYSNFTTAEGQNALLSLTSGAANTGVGWSSLSSDTTASFNTGVGAGALLANTGDQNTAIGVAAGLNLTTGNNNICIGSGVGGVAGENNTIRIGDNLGNASGSSACYIGGIHGQPYDAATGLSIRVDANDKLGTNPSSKRFKKDIKPMDKASEAILALKPVAFHYKSDKKSIPQFGLVAEDVAQVNPDLIVRDKNGELLSVRYDEVNAMLLNEFLKEHKRVEEQSGKLEDQARKIQQQEATIAELRREIQVVVAHQKAQDSKIQKVTSQVEMSKAQQFASSSD